MLAAQLDAMLRRDRTLVLAGLATVIVLAWIYILLGAGLAMNTMDMGGGITMVMAPIWTTGSVALIFAMWAIMMAAMMLPSAAPTILLITALARQHTSTSGGAAPATAGYFTIGYLSIWLGFSAVATLLQWGLDRAGLMSEMMESTSVRLAALILIAAGLYQWTPSKRICLAHCRSPLDFLLRHWRDGAWGAMASGMMHGLFCLGCCWVLMALLFVGGLMNPLWIAALAALVLVEKTFPWGGRMSLVTGATLFVWGVVTLAFAIRA